jgi:hypothetical protein
MNITDSSSVSGEEKEKVKMRKPRCTHVITHPLNYGLIPSFMNRGGLPKASKAVRESTPVIQNGCGHIRRNTVIQVV